MPDPVTGNVPDHATRMGPGVCDVLEHLPTDGHGDPGGWAATLIVTVDLVAEKTLPIGDDRHFDVPTGWVSLEM